MSDEARTIEYMPLGSIREAPRNPKRHALAELEASIDRFGYVEPMVVDERTGQLVVGHGRLEQLRRMSGAGLDPPAGVRVNGEGWEVPVIRGWASADEAEAEAYLLASNRITERGGWDDRGLAEMLGDLRDADTGLAGTGWSEPDLSALLASLAEPLPPDDFPPADDGTMKFGHACPRCGFEFDDK